MFPRCCPIIDPALRRKTVCTKGDWNEAGERFVPIRLSGAWWPTDGRPSLVSVARTLLPEAFQQALGRSTAEGTLHLGYPLDVFRAGSSGLMVRAVCSVPLRWKVAANDVVVFETIETSLTLNAGWMNFHRKQVNLKGLAERIAPGFPSAVGCFAGGRRRLGSWRCRERGCARWPEEGCRHRGS